MAFNFRFDNTDPNTERARMLLMYLAILFITVALGPAMAPSGGVSTTASGDFEIGTALLWQGTPRQIANHLLSFFFNGVLLELSSLFVWKVSDGYPLNDQVKCGNVFLNVNFFNLWLITTPSHFIGWFLGVAAGSTTVVACIWNFHVILDYLVQRRVAGKKRDDEEKLIGNEEKLIGNDVMEN